MIRYEIVDSKVNEMVVHPESLFDHEQELARNFVENHNVSSNIDNCPICGHRRDEVLFEKWGQKYVICTETWSLCLASMPDKEILKEYFYTSELAQFRASKYYQDEVAKKRVEFWKSQAEWIDGRIKRYSGGGKYDVVDWGTKVVSWYETLKDASFVKNIYIKDPLPPVKEIDFNDKVDVVCLMDVIQRHTHPGSLLKDIYGALKAGGLVIATCRAGSGFDILSLRENSESVFPFDHICLPSPQGVKLMLEQAGFEVLEITTPGLLDVDFLRKGAASVSKDQYFQRFVLAQQSELVFESLQAFLQRNNLSSHLRVVARKVEGKR